GGGHRAPSDDSFLFWLLNRIRATGVTEVEHQELHGLVRAVGEVVPPARAPIVHEGLPRRVVLRALNPDRTCLIFPRQYAFTDVDAGRNSSLLTARLPSAF